MRSRSNAIGADDGAAALDGAAGRGPCGALCHSGQSRWSLAAGMVRGEIRAMEPPALLRLREQRLLAVIRARSWDAALAAANAVVRGGITMIEVTFTVPEAPRVMARLGGR